jgi:hypothetical protein
LEPLAQLVLLELQDLVQQRSDLPELLVPEVRKDLEEIKVPPVRMVRMVRTEPLAQTDLDTQDTQVRQEHLRLLQGRQERPDLLERTALA